MRSDCLAVSGMFLSGRVLGWSRCRVVWLGGEPGYRLRSNR